MTALRSVRLIFDRGRNQNLTADNTDQTDFHRSREAGTKEREGAEASAKIGTRTSVIEQDRIEQKRAGRNGPLEGHQPRR